MSLLLMLYLQGSLSVSGHSSEDVREEEIEREGGREGEGKAQLAHGIVPQFSSQKKSKAITATQSLPLSSYHPSPPDAPSPQPSTHTSAHHLPSNMDGHHVRESEQQSYEQRGSMASSSDATLTAITEGVRRLDAR